MLSLPTFIDIRYVAEMQQEICRLSKKKSWKKQIIGFVKCERSIVIDFCTFLGEVKQYMARMKKKNVKASLPAELDASRLCDTFAGHTRVNVQSLCTENILPNAATCANTLGWVYM